MSTKTKKKYILITGCSSGIGLDAAKFLRLHGWTVFASARKQEDVLALKAQSFECFQLDLRNVKQVKNTLNEVLKLSDGKLDALFNNAAYAQPGALEDLDTDDLKAQFETNVFAWHELTKQAIKIMRNQGGYGRIVQNSSILGFINTRFRGAYSASKFTIESLSDTLRLELADTNIKVILLEPGPITSKFRQNAKVQFLQNIDYENSVHKKAYQKTLERFHSDEKDPFQLEASAVSKQLLKALESANPKCRYRITVPTKIFMVLKRLLSTKLLDKLLLRV